ncbi:hypothetical protein E1B28_012062 [Marasmius oreades]|uniref:Uncharacterized protein n=1 Tax=Marasmius oreades TaxID=181124 RepID=A0A9P7UNJ4_9AGAR|nr:uncharacterized protein E1B28_012062 [Marasmius oreades]KAG7088025.1 hypothetical protein E1B28_012062 [Marasmius oreades]
MSMSASTPSPMSSLLTEESPHTPEPSRSTSSLLHAHASPLADFRGHKDEEHQAPVTVQAIASDVPFDKEVEGDDISVDQLLPTTPAVHTIGRTGFSRESVFLRVVVMHLYAARCMLTLTQNCLQMAHIIPVSAPANFLRFLERVLGDEPRTLNRHSSRNIWLLDASMHYNIDKGLMKLVPTIEILEKIRKFTRLISEIRIRRLEHEYNVKIVKMGGDFKAVFPKDADWNTATNVRQKERNARLDALMEEDLELHRSKVLPPALYPYIVIGIRCHEEYSFYRQVVNVNMVSDGTQKPFQNPLKIPNDMLQKQQVDKFRRPTTFPFLRGIKGEKKKFEIIDPLEYDEERELLLGQDPCLVLANVGEFLSVTRERLQQDGEALDMSELVRDEVHQEHLQVTLDTYMQWETDDKRILSIQGTLEKRTQTQTAAARSRKSRKTTSTHSYGLRSVVDGLMANAPKRPVPGVNLDDPKLSREYVPSRDGELPSPSARGSRRGSQRGGQATLLGMSGWTGAARDGPGPSNP